MAKITEKIDLTLNSIFAGDTNPSLMPGNWRVNRQNFFVPDLFFGTLKHIMRRHINSILPNFESSNFLKPTPLDDSMTYFRLFREFQPHIYEETMGWGDPNHCAMCGASTNLINRNTCNDSCDECANRIEYISL